MSGNFPHRRKSKQGNRKHPTPPPGLILPPGQSLSLHAILHLLRHRAQYEKTSRHPQNRKYITYCNATRAGPNHGHRQHAWKIRCSSDVWFLRYVARVQTYRPTVTQTNAHYNTPLTCQGRNNIKIKFKISRNNVATMREYPIDKNSPFVAHRLTLGLLFDIFIYLFETGLFSQSSVVVLYACAISLISY